MDGLGDFSFKQVKIKTPKLESVKYVKSGDRTLKQSDKTKLKREKGFRCQRCHKKFERKMLEVHHKRAVHKSKKKYDPGRIVIGKRKAYHDRKENLMVLCPNCHKKVHDEESAKNRKNKRRSSGLGALIGRLPA